MLFETRLQPGEDSLDFLFEGHFQVPAFIAALLVLELQDEFEHLVSLPLDLTHAESEVVQDVEGELRGGGRGSPGALLPLQELDDEEVGLFQDIEFPFQTLLIDGAESPALTDDSPELGNGFLKFEVLLSGRLEFRLLGVAG